MEAGTTVGAAQPLREENGAAPPDGIEAAARGESVSVGDEVDALAWLLGQHAALQYRVPTKIATDQGDGELTFVIRQIDTGKISSIEEQHRSQETGIVDSLKAAFGIVAEATVALVSATGRELSPTSEEWRTVTVRRDPDSPPERVTLAMPMMAFERRFAKQGGVILGVAAEVRKVSGFSPDRVGNAERLLVEASGNS